MSLNAAHTQWEQCTVTYGYPVKTMAVMGSNLYTGTFGGGVYLTSDNGESWLEVNNGLTETDVRSLAVHGNNLYAGTWGAGIFLSTDKGQSWSAVNSGLESIYVASIVSIGSNIMAGTYDGIFLSTDNGSSWTAYNNGLTILYTKAIEVSGSNIYAGTWQGGVFLSTDNGANWSTLNEGLPGKDILSLAVIGSNILAGTINGLFLSTDNGLNWTAINNEVTGLPNYKIEALLVNEGIVYAGVYGKGIYYSTDNGLSWSQINNGLPENPLILSLAISGNNIYAGTGNFGVLRAKISDFGITGFSADNPFAEDIKITPNPATDYIEVAIPPLERGLGGVLPDVRVYDVLGIEHTVSTMSFLRKQESPVNTDEIPGQAGNDSSIIRLDVSHLPPGVYYVQIGSRVQRFVKM